MLSLKSVKRKYKIQLALLGISILLTLVISFSNVLPKYSIDYIVPTTITLIIIMLLYSYILLLKNHIEDLENENNVLNKKLLISVPVGKKSLISSGVYQFDVKFGFYKNKQTGELFCSPCLLKDIPAQLKEFDDYWRCTNCGHWYYKEHYKPFQNEQKKDKGDNWATNW
jgi:hypothetical protein